jgi:inward rectifier potassium channel
MRSRPRKLSGQLASGREVVAIGMPRRPFRDLYHGLLTTSWTRLFLGFAAAYVGTNALFALGYVALGDSIEHAEPGSVRDAFFFSVQTMATIGYGLLAPKTFAAEILVTIEAFVGLLGFAVVTGLVFSKFSRPTARVLFSRVLVVTDYDGTPSLLVRMANERANQIAEARLTLSLVRDERTAEGAAVRRVHDLSLVRPQNPFFALTWTAIHPILRESPLHGQDAAALERSDTTFVATLVGFDESFSQTIHARQAWSPSEVLFGYRFVDVLSARPDGRRQIDYRKFHEVEPDGSAVSRPSRAPAAEVPGFLDKAGGRS